MKMASYVWTDINADIRLIYTKKKFFGQFYCSLQYHVPKCRLALNWSAEDGGEKLVSSIVWSGTYDHRYDFLYANPARHPNFSQLAEFGAVYYDKSLGFRYRLEQNFITIYAVSEDQLYDVATNQLQHWKADATQVSILKHEDDIIELDQGSIFTDGPIEYEWKVIIREGPYSIRDKNAVGQYISGLGNLIKISKSLLRSLHSVSKYQQGGYFYTNDPRIADMIRLITPSIIGSMHKLVRRQQSTN